MKGLCYGSRRHRLKEAVEKLAQALGTKMKSTAMSRGTQFWIEAKDGRKVEFCMHHMHAKHFLYQRC